MRPWILNAGICWTVLITFCCLSLLPVDAGAVLVESRLADGASLSTRTERLESVRQVLETEVVKQRLADYGLSSEEVAARLPELSDSQLHQLAGLSDSLAEGGFLGEVIAVLVIVLLVVLILRLHDKQIVIK